MRISIIIILVLLPALLSAEGPYVYFAPGYHTSSGSDIGDIDVKMSGLFMNLGIGIEGKNEDFSLNFQYFNFDGRSGGYYIDNHGGNFSIKVKFDL